MPSRLTEEEQANIKDLYQHGKGTIQDYARIYRVSVPEILEIIGENHLGAVTIGDGDQVDEAELGPTGRGMVEGPPTVEVPFNLN